jgi:hypothetical protein
MADLNQAGYGTPFGGTGMLFLIILVLVIFPGWPFLSGPCT